MRGSIGTVPPDEARDGQRVLHVFTDERNADPTIGAGGGPFLDMEILVRLLSSQVGMPVADRTTEPPSQPFYVHFHDSGYGTRRFELLIANLEAQTDLEVDVERQLDDVVLVSKKRP